MFRYGEELLKLEKVTLECIQETLQTIQDTEGKPFNPTDMFHLLIEHILAILVRTKLHYWLLWTFHAHVETS